MRLFKAFIFILIIALLFYGAFSLPKFIIIKKITCTSQFGPCNQNLVEEIEKVRNMNISESQKALKRIFAESIFVKEYLIQYSFPDGLRVNILEKKPLYALKERDKDTFALVGREGYVFAFQEKSNLPTLEISKPAPSINEKVNDSTLFALEIMYDVYFSYKVSKGTLEKDRLIIKIEDGPEIIFPLEGDRDVLLGSLTLILSRLNSENQDFRIEEAQGINTIDLRFKNPVIR